MGHAQQVPQNIGRSAGQANQYGGVVEIVVGNIIDIGVGCEKFSPVVQADSNHKRTRLSRMMSGRACQQFSPNLIISAGDPKAVLASTPGSANPSFLTVSKLIALFAIRRVRTCARR
jgi:hypothetical protein